MERKKSQDGENMGDWKVPFLYIVKVKLGKALYCSQLIRNHFLDGKYEKNIAMHWLGTMDIALT